MRFLHARHEGSASGKEQTMKRRPSLILGAALIAVIASLGIARANPGPAPGQGVQAPLFEVDPLWPKPLPDHQLLGSAVGVAVDARDHIFVINLTNTFNARTEIGLASTPPTGECCKPTSAVLEFDAEGSLIRQWGGPGQGYTWPAANHGIAIDNQGNVWIAGSGGTDTQILKFSREGRFLMAVGKLAAAPQPVAGGGGGVAGDTAGGGRRGGRGGARGAPPPSLPPASNSTDSFGGAAEISFDTPAGEAFVADGYRNRRIAVIDMGTGRIKRFFGAYGNRPEDAALPAYNGAAKQFGTPVRCAELSADGMVYVCDRTNNRIQVFRKDGTFVKERVVAPETRGAGSVWDIAFSRDAQQRYLYVADGMNMKVHILDRQSLDVLTSFGDGGRQPGQFFGVHSIATDSRGNIYTTETYEGKRVQKFVFKGIGAVTNRNRGVVWPGR
jgi:DNA-binding beta-propeller fold protein YncE